MKGILKIYHPEETLKYHIKNTYCKAVYSNSEHLLEVEVITDESLDHVDDDSLQYNFPQLSLEVIDFPLENGEIEGKTFRIADTDESSYTEIDLFDDEEAYLLSNELTFEKNGDGILQLCWQGEITDFYTGSDEPVPFKLKCNFREDEIIVEDE